MLQFAAFESLTKKLYTGHESQNQHTAQHFICGACAGSLATVASYPLDVLRTRFVTQGKVQVRSFEVCPPPRVGVIVICCN